MTTVVVFHSVLGIRQGERDAAARLRAEGHEVLVPDLYEGRLFDEYEPAMAFSEKLGMETLCARALAAVAQLPDGFVVSGFSQGSSVAVYVATQRPVSAVVQFSGANVLEWFGEDASWPAGADSQTHQTIDDPFREPQVEEQAAADVAAGGGTLESYLYPGSGHLFTDPTLSAEFDPAATELMWSRVLPFVRSRSAGATSHTQPASERQSAASSENGLSR